MSVVPAPDPELVRATSWLAGLLWPRHRPHLAPPGESDADFLALPTGAREWLLLPGGSPASTAGAVDVGHAGRNALRTIALRASLRLGRGVARASSGVSFRPDTASGTDATLLTHLAGALGVDGLRGAVQVRTPRAHGKPVVRLLAPDGVTIGFAKVGWNQLTRRLLANEVAWLADPAVRGLRHVRAPEVLHRSRWNDLDVVVVSDEGPTHAWAPRPPRPSAFRELAGLAGVDVRPVTSLPLWTTVAQRAHEPSWQVAQERITRRHDGTHVLVGAWHGDWVAQNCWTGSTTTCLWDWEFAQSGVPVGFDVLHNRAQPLLWRDREPVHHALARAVDGARRALTALGLSRAAQDAVADLYPLALADRYLSHAGNGPLRPRVHRLVHDLVRAVPLTGEGS